ncbi:MAG: SurA N-terminal domain-containing protein [Muribaculaceae bacterium]|nr:SurA N-terminal domain-containing protein [Muribaculaceae bacterium]
MSALEQIRKRPALIISILGLALLLFIFTAISNPEKLFSDPSTIAKVDGKKIDYTDFQQRVDQLRSQYEAQGYKNIDNAMLQEQAMQSLIDEQLMNAEMEKLGIVVTPEELGQVMLGQNIPMAIQQLYFQRQQQGLYTGYELHELATNPQAYGLDAQTAAAYKQQWADLVEQVRQMLTQQKFAALLSGALAANDLDAQAQYTENNGSREIRFVKVDASTVSDSDVEVTDSEIRNQYEADKNLYRLDDDAYMISYIMSNVTPSDADRLEATQAVEGALMGMREQPGTKALADNNKFVVTRLNTAEKYLPANIKDKLESLKQDTVQQLSFYDNKYTLAKYLGSDVAVDSISFDIIGIAETANVDSILSALNAGAALADMPEGAIMQSQLDQRVSLLNGNPNINLVLANATVGEYFNAPDYTGTPNMVFRLVSKDAPVPVYSIAEVTYQLEPSAATINDTQSRLRAYVANNSNSKDFAANAVSAGYVAVPATVTNSSLSVNNIADTRALAKWAVNAKRGDVSDVYSNDDKSFFIAAALNNKYDKGYTPFTDTQVNAQSRAKAVRGKKISVLADRFNGKGNSVDQYASAMNAKVDTATVTFGQNYVRGFMPGDGKLIAAVAAAKSGEFAGLVPTDYSVVAFEVIGDNAPEREFDAVNDVTYFQQAQGANSVLRNWNLILRANKSVDNKIQKFFND